MPLTAGTRLGPYEILAPLGAGSIGKARDTRFDRVHRGNTSDQCLIRRIFYG